MSELSSPINLEFLPDWARGAPRAGAHGTCGTSAESTSVLRTTADKPADLSPEACAKAGESSSKSSFPGSTEKNFRKSKPADLKNKSFQKPSRRRPPANNQPPRSSFQEKAPIRISFLPESRALKSVGEQIRTTARAYPLFSLARMFLEKPERHEVKLSLKEKQNTSQFLYQCCICKHVLLEETDSVFHVLKSHQDLFYKIDRQEVSPPKGNFTSVARCELNGKILGPSNHHTYQSNLLQLYRAEFKHLPFEKFKQSIVSIHDPEVVKQWQQSLCWQTTFIPLKTTDSKALSEAEVEHHFREHHFTSEVRKGTDFILPGEASRQLKDSYLMSSIRHAWEDEDGFPVHFSRRLQGDFVKMGLHVFKGKKGAQFVTLARPNPLVPNASNVSKTICAMMEFIQAHPRTDRKSVMDALSQANPSFSGETQKPREPSLIQDANIAQDLHWLIRQGHVIEYHNGHLEVVSIPKPRPEDSKSKSEVVSQTDPQIGEKSSHAN